MRGCQKCKESKGEGIIRNFLEKNCIKYEPQKKFAKCKDINLLPFDFYLTTDNICIEFDGKQHFDSIERYGGNVGLKYIQTHDKIKNEFCKNNNIKLIRISYKENIIERLDSELL